MKTAIQTYVFSALLALPGAAYAQVPAASKAAGGMNCSMMENHGAMQKNMGTMMKDMNVMMAGTSDPAMKARMEKMHGQMAMMMANMKKMGGGMGAMMGGHAMTGGQGAGPPLSAPPPATAEDHDAHHPRQ
jgi:hypothetical protein